MQARAEATERHESHTELKKLWCRRAWRGHFKCNPPMRVLKSDQSDDGSM